MKRFEVCIPRILAHEGGYVNDPQDPGGATNRGITLATFRAHVNPNGTAEDLKRLTEAQAVKVYKAQYWDAVSADKLPVGVDYAVADFAVNSGPARAAKYLQRVVGAAQDGKIGPATLAAVASVSPASVVEAITADRMTFLRGLKTWGRFGKGWTKRVQDVRRLALADMQAAPTPVAASPAPDPVIKPAVEVPAQSGWAAIIAAIMRLFRRD